MINRRVLQGNAKCWLKKLALVSILAIVSSPVYASTILATNVSGNSGILAAGEGVVGYQFNVLDQAFEVMKLGVFDPNGDGLANAHDVGIFDLGGTLLTSASVAAGAVADLEEGFRWATLGSPLTLSANTSYVIVATMAHFDQVDLYRTSATINPLFSLSFGATRYDFGSGLLFPTLTSSLINDLGFFGPNLGGEAVRVSAVPDGGSTLGLLGVGLIGISAIRRKLLL